VGSPLARTHRNPLAVDKSRCSFALWVAFALLATSALCNVEVVAAQTGTAFRGRALVEALREGGYNIYFRHAATNWSQADRVAEAGDWTSCDPDRMRQLADAGRRTASAIGEAMRALQIPVAHVFASPYCRAVETARLMQLGKIETTTDIMNMRVAEYFGGPSAIIEHARQRLSTPPHAGTNIVLVAHGNVFRDATGVYPKEAEAIVCRPAGKGNHSVVARIPPQAWERLVAEYGNRTPQ